MFCPAIRCVLICSFRFILSQILLSPTRFESIRFVLIHFLNVYLFGMFLGLMRKCSKVVGGCGEAGLCGAGVGWVCGVGSMWGRVSLGVQWSRFVG